MNTTPQGERTHIAIFGRRNVGKSSLINAVTAQEVAIVSDVQGTTTDPVYKAMELLPLGAVVIIDTPGIDDEGDLGTLRVQRTREILRKTDIALFVLESDTTITSLELEILNSIHRRKTPLVIVFNKCDQHPPTPALMQQVAHFSATRPQVVSASTLQGIENLKLTLAQLIPDEQTPRPLVHDLLKSGDLVLLVTPIDAAAPKGRLILPQQQMIRDIMAVQASALITADPDVRPILRHLKQPPQLVITDSQVFEEVARHLPATIPLTSFSILFARYKGDLAELVRGAQAIGALQDGDRILIAEGCTHHRQTDDIGTVKIPRWLKDYTGKELYFDHASGIQYPANLQQYALILHCGSCMLNRREMQYRIQQAREAHLPIVNYGVAIAYLKGILQRSLAPLGLSPNAEVRGATLSSKE